MTEIEMDHVNVGMDATMLVCTLIIIGPAQSYNHDNNLSNPPCRQG